MTMPIDRTTLIADLRRLAQERAKASGYPFWGNLSEAVAATILEAEQAKRLAKANQKGRCG